MVEVNLLTGNIQKIGEGNNWMISWIRANASKLSTRFRFPSRRGARGVSAVFTRNLLRATAFYLRWPLCLQWNMFIVMQRLWRFHLKKELIISSTWHFKPYKFTCVWPVLWAAQIPAFLCKSTINLFEIRPMTDSSASQEIQRRFLF